MANRKPLVNVAGQIQQLQDADDLDLLANILRAQQISVTSTAAIGGETQAAGGLLVSSDSSKRYSVQRTVENTEVADMDPGQVVYLTGADEVKLAQADDATTAQAFGVTGGTITASSTGTIVIEGQVDNTTGEWDAVTGDTGGLVPGAVYYLSGTTAGGLTRTKPTSSEHYVVQVGVAISTTTLLLYGFEVQPNPVLSADLDIYVDTGGDDTDGDGTSSNPYLTIQRAAEHFLPLIPGNNFINVHINAGVHTVSEKYQVAYGFGSGLKWIGETETVNTPTIANIDGSVSTDANYASLEYLDFDLTLTGAAGAVGYFVKLSGCTGGTNPEGLDGLHEIVAWNDATDVATCRVWRADGTTELPSGAITVSSALLIKSVLHFTADDHAIDVRGPFDLGDWDGIVIRGNADAFTTKRAVRLFNGAGIRSATFTGLTGLYIFEWDTGFEIIGNSSVYSQNGAVAKCDANAIRASFGSTVRYTGATINGAAARALWATDNSNIAATSIRIHSCGVNTVNSTEGAFIDVSSGQISFDQAAETAVVADNLGRVYATGVTITGYTTDFSPTVNALGSNGSYIGTA